MQQHDSSDSASSAVESLGEKAIIETVKASQQRDVPREEQSDPTPSEDPLAEGSPSAQAPMSENNEVGGTCIAQRSTGPLVDASQGPSVGSG